MGVLLIVAEMQEAQPLIAHYSLKKLNLRSIDLWENDELRLLITGAGVNNVISSLSKAILFRYLNPFTHIINVGYAGAKGLNIGDVVCVKDCHCLEFPAKANTGVENCIKLSNEGYDCYTSFDFVEKTDFVYQCVFDMELAYIARFIHDTLYSIKIISDNLDYHEFKKFDADKAWKEAINKIEERRKTYVSRYFAP